MDTVVATFESLEGVKGKRDAVFVHSATAAIAALRKGLVGTSARDNGAMDVWIDDSGKYRGAAHRYGATFERASFETQRAVKAWWNELYAKIA